MENLLELLPGYGSLPFIGKKVNTPDFIQIKMYQ